MKLHAHEVRHSYGSLPVLDGVDLEVPEGGIAAVLGPSGCGKTTLLRILGGLTLPESGSVSRRPEGSVSFLFQEPRLLPWESCRANVELVLESTGRMRDRLAVADRMLRLVGLGEFAHATPWRLSGGMRQRLALARAFAFPSGLILMDEPFQSLDIALKLELLRAFQELRERQLRTAVCVTHDVHEASFLGDTLLILSPRPARVIARIENPVTRDRREFGSSEMIELEHRLYDLLLGSERRGGGDARTN